MHRMRVSIALLLFLGCSDQEEVTLQTQTAVKSSATRQVRVHYDTGWGYAIALRGNGGGLSWSGGAAATWTPGNIWVWEIPAWAGSFEFKPLLDDQSWSVGANYTVPSTGSVDVYPFFGPSQGTLFSHTMPNGRKTIVYLPPSYFENTAKFYPVLYLHDGQNVFQSSTAFGGVEWGVDETMNVLVSQGAVREAIVVGIYNTAARPAEYTPTPDPSYGGGQADGYLDMIEQFVMPTINGSYRVLTGPTNTFLMGSSLGGLVSFYAGWTRSGVYGAAGCVSGSFWWDNESLTQTVEDYLGPKVPCRFYLDAGGKEPLWEETERMRDALEGLGYQHGADLAHWFEPAGAHNEASWAARVHRPLKFLLGN